MQFESFYFTNVLQNRFNIAEAQTFCFTFDFDETFLDCSTHEYYNLTKFRQNWMYIKKNQLWQRYVDMNFNLAKLIQRR